jgi:hypothetical protein
MEMEEQSSIYKSQENEQISQEQSNIDNITNNISNKNIENIPSQLTQFPSKAQIYHYEKTIHDLSIQNSSLSSRIENLLLQLEKSNALIDSHKTENGILKSQIINQTNNNKILEEKNMENEIKIKELKSLNEKIVKNQKIKYESLVGEISEKEKIIQKLNEQLKAKEESIKYFTINDNLEKKYQLNYKNELEKERYENKKLQEKINQLNNQIDGLYVQNQSESLLMLEIEKLKNDNIRLIQMLKAMKYAEDLESLSTDSSSVIKSIKIYDKKYQKNNNNNLLLNDVYNYSIQLKQRFGLDISNEYLKNFVAGINQIWQDKYEKDMKQVKLNLRKELDSYQKQIMDKNKNNTNISGNNIDNMKYNKAYEKGCFWMAERCDEEMNELENNFEELLLEYENKIKNADKEKIENTEYFMRLINNCIKWFFSTLKCMIIDIKNKIENWKNEIKKKCDYY